jgi:LacI family transcriptional regulator
MPNTPKNRIKLVDIAQATGVSLTAVSLALSDKPGISQETRNRVLESARSLGYRFKSTVAASPVRSIKTVGLWVKSGLEDRPQDNQFYSHIISGIEAAWRQMDINLMVAKLPVDGDHHPVEIPAMLEKGDIDAVMLAGVSVDGRLERMLASRGCPVVLVDSYSSGRAYNTILSDNLQGTYRATEYLIGKGHRQIGFVGGHERSYPSLRDRRSGYRKALADFGIDSVYFADCLPTRSEAAAAAVELIRQNGQISGLVCVNDDTAIAAMAALIEQGLRVPQDISIIGFDDIYLAESVVPALTTMRVNKQSMGRLAVQLLINQVFQMDGAGSVTAVFRPSLVERSSASVFNETATGEGRSEGLARRIMTDG